MPKDNKNLFGFLNIDKPQGMTSHDVVGKVRRILGIKRVGHAGTLDPMATGVLVVCVGNATRLSEYVMSHTKVYKATIKFGVETDTYDADGDIVSTSDKLITEQQLIDLMPQFMGDIQQVPPMYSAIKQGGKKLYELARQGKEVERPPRDVSIYELDLIEWNNDEQSATVRIQCSAGTYIRSLAYDLGKTLDVGAHLTALVREQSGTADLNDAMTLDQLANCFEEKQSSACFLDEEWALPDIDRVELDDDAVKIIRNGGFVPRDIEMPSLARAYEPNGRFIGLIEAYPKDDMLWKPKKILT